MMIAIDSLKRDEIQHVQNFTTTSTTSLIACPKLLDQQVTIKLGTGFRKVKCMFYSGIVYYSRRCLPGRNTANFLFLSFSTSMQCAADSLKNLLRAKNIVAAAL